MFTGLIETNGKFLGRKIVNGSNEMNFQVNGNPWGDLVLGESIAVNGVCLTVVEFGRDNFKANISDATIKSTNLSLLKINEIVNLERSLQIGSRLGGHFVTGHVDGVGRISEIISRQNEMIFKIEPSLELMPFMVLKGAVALNGISLTIQKVDRKDFSVSIIPYTLKHTTIDEWKNGCMVNIETDILWKYAKGLG